MPRTPRSDLPADGVFHVTARGVADEPIFRHDVDRLDFLSLLEAAAPVAGWTCLAWCLMTTHYHLVLETSREPLSRAMHGLNATYAHRFNRRHRRRGHLFASRFSAWVVRDERHVAATCAYVLANPVRAGICETAEEWPWSWAAATSATSEPRSR